MLNEFLQDQAAVYVAGAMTSEERVEFELVLEVHSELRAFTAGLADVAVAVTVATQGTPNSRPSSALKARLTGFIASHPQQSHKGGLVMTGAEGFVEWVNPDFVEMCGYTLDELRGKKLGPILQGAGTDRETAERMRRSVHELRPCHETILNYRKNGAPYWVEIDITPILDGGGQPLMFVAREREVLNRIAA